MPDGTFTPADALIPRGPERIPPKSRMAQSAKRFHALSMPMHGETGMVDRSKLTPAQIDRLKTWRNEGRGENGDAMPTQERFDDNLFLLQSLWPQKEGGKVHYTLGLDTASEVGFQGRAVGRKKRPVAVPYMSHKKFTCYGVEAASDPNDASKQVPAVPEAVRTIFDDQDYFTPGETAWLRDVPPELMGEQAQEVDYEGLTFFVPPLEVMVVDSLEAEGTMKAVEVDAFEREDFDSGFLMRQYEMDKDKVLELRRFSKTPWFNPEESRAIKATNEARYIQLVRDEFLEQQRLLNKSAGASFNMSEVIRLVNLKKQITQERQQAPNMTTLDSLDDDEFLRGVWKELGAGDIDQDGNLTETFREEVGRHFLGMAETERERFLVDDAANVISFLEGVDEQGNVDLSQERYTELVYELQDEYDFDWHKALSSS